MIARSIVQQPMTSWTLGQQILVISVFDMGTETPAVEIVRNGWNKHVPSQNIYVLFVWSFCRLMRPSCKSCMMTRIFAHPMKFSWFVDSMIGQEAASVAKEFNEQPKISQVSFLLKLTVTHVVVRLFLFVISARPIKEFTGTGEKITDIETFHRPYGNRILGMGDLLTILKKLLKEYVKKSTWVVQKRYIEKSPTTNFIDQLDQVQEIWVLWRICLRCCQVWLTIQPWLMLK